MRQPKSISYSNLLYAFLVIISEYCLLDIFNNLKIDLDFSANKSMGGLLKVETLSLDRTSFKWWQEKMLFVLDSFEVGYILVT